MLPDGTVERVGGREGMEMAILVLLGIALYFLPAIVAAKRHHRNADAIAVLNLFLGWTLIGWVVALTWSATRDVEAR